MPPWENLYKIFLLLCYYYNKRFQLRLYLSLLCQGIYSKLIKHILTLSLCASWKSQAQLRESQKIQVFLLRKQDHMACLTVVKPHLGSEMGLRTLELPIKGVTCVHLEWSWNLKNHLCWDDCAQMHINTTCLIMHSFLFALLFSENLFSKNKPKVCSPSLSKTYSYRSRWEHKGRKKSFQAEMSEISFKLKEEKRNTIWDTIWDTSRMPWY